MDHLGGDALIRSALTSTSLDNRKRACETSMAVTEWLKMFKRETSGVRLDDDVQIL
jgi:hypothetical protein